MEVQYIGKTPTLVRIDGVKKPVEPDETFEIEDKEGKELVEGHYRNLFIVAGTEPGEKQNPANNKFQSAPIVEQPKTDAPKTTGNAEIDAIIAQIEDAPSIDELNKLATDVANDETLEENEAVNEAVEKRMAELMDVDAEGKPKADANKAVAPVAPKAEAPKKSKAAKKVGKKSKK